MNIHLKKLQSLTNHIDNIWIYLDNNDQKYSVIIDDMKINLCGNLLFYFSKVIDDIQEFLIKRKFHIENCNLRSIINKLEKLRIEYFRDEWRLKNEDIINEIKYNGFLVSKKYIIYHKLIPLQYIINNEKYYNIPEDFRTQKNLFIKSVKIEISNTFKTIILCNGVHPNLDTSNNQFCLDSDLSKLSLNFKNLLLVIESMKIANLDRCYNFSIFKEMFKPIILEGDKINEIKV